MKSFVELQEERRKDIDAVFAGLDPSSLTPAQETALGEQVEEKDSHWETEFDAWKKGLVALHVDALKEQLTEWKFTIPTDIRAKAKLVDAYIEHERGA